MTRLSLVDTFANRELAEFAQLRLKDEGIESSLDNANLIGWFWQYGIAVGGVKLFVDLADVARADEALSRSTNTPPQPSAFCPQCHEALPASWEVCWRCAAQSEQPADSSPLDSSGPLPAKTTDRDRVVTAIAVTAFGLVTFFTLGITGLLIAVAIIATVKVIFGQSAETPSVEPEQMLPAEAEALPEPPRNELAEEQASRAWKASVLGLVWFPPLTLYALYLAFQTNPPGPPMAAAGQRRINLAIVVAFGTIGMWLAYGMFMFGGR